MTKKMILFFFIVPALFTACGNDVEKKAKEKLQVAQTAYEQGNYQEAKLQIDSIKVLYPKAFEARKAAQNLLMDVELKAQQDTLLLLDSLLQVQQQAFEAIKGNYRLEKDTAYQQIGNYIMPSQTIEKNLHRSFLRFQTNEQGVMSMTSIYCGSNNIHHTSIKIIASDGNFAQTPQSPDSYETEDMGEKIEKADYKLGEDGDVIQFIALNYDKNLRAEYIGERKYTTTLPPSDKIAAVEISKLAQILSSIQQIDKKQKDANLKIEFIQKKKTRTAEKAESGE